MPKFIDLTGKRFGRLIILRKSGKDKYGKINWNCVCDCARETVVSGSSLRRGLTKSCGCLQKESQLSAVTTHGHSRVAKQTPEYKCWSGMKRRCYNKNSKSFHNYGGRGITVCERWVNSFENFLSDMGERPTSKHSLDRVDVNGIYEPSNCRWATNSEQEMNKRTTSRNTSGHKGVSWHKKIKRWVATITIDGKHIFLGSYGSIEEAIEARKQGEIKYWHKKPS